MPTGLRPQWSEAETTWAGRVTMFFTRLGALATLQTLLLRSLEEPPPAEAGKPYLPPAAVVTPQHTSWCLEHSWIPSVGVAFKVLVKTHFSNFIHTPERFSVISLSLLMNLGSPDCDVYPIPNQVNL